MTNNFNFCIISDLNYLTAIIKTVNETTLKIQGIRTIKFYIFIKNRYKNMEISNVYYLSGFNANLILLKVLKRNNASYVLSIIFYRPKKISVLLCLN